MIVKLSKKNGFFKYNTLSINEERDYITFAHGTYKVFPSIKTVHYYTHYVNDRLEGIDIQVFNK